MKILCKKCGMPVAFMSGNLISIKRGKDLIQIVGKDVDVLASCAGHCGNQTAIMIEKGEIVGELLTEGEKDEPNKQIIGDKQKEEDE